MDCSIIVYIELFTILEYSIHINLSGHFFVQTVNTPKVFTKFIQLKYLAIEVSTSKFSQDYDLCSLISFLDASPALESLIVRVCHHLSLTSYRLENSYFG